VESNSVCNHTRSQLITFNVPITYTHKYASFGRRKYFTLFIYVFSFFSLHYFFFRSQREASGNVTFKIVPSSRNINQVSEVRDMCRLRFCCEYKHSLVEQSCIKLYKGWVSCYLIREESGTFWCPIHFANYTRKRVTEMKMFRCGWYE